MQGQNARFRLGYWKIRGLAQAVRLVFEFSATKYEEELYEQGDAPEFSREQWTRAKPVLAAQNPFMNLPYLIDKELQRPLTESKAILLHLARVLDLHGKTEQGDAVVCFERAKQCLCCFVFLTLVQKKCAMWRM
jgi:glutathione S-transferase